MLLAPETSGPALDPRWYPNERGECDCFLCARRVVYLEAVFFGPVPPPNVSPLQTPRLPSHLACMTRMLAQPGGETTLQLQWRNNIAGIHSVALPKAILRGENIH